MSGPQMFETPKVIQRYYRWCSCGEIFKQKSSFEGHLARCSARKNKSLSNPATIYCDYCSEVFANDEAHCEHRDSVGHGFPLYNFMCMHCNKRFKAESQFEDHLTRFHGYHCPHCKPRFSDIDCRKFEQHMVFDHNYRQSQLPWIEEAMAKFTVAPCPDCGVQYQKRIELMNHQFQASHGYYRTCPKCHMVCLAQDVYKYHRRMHYYMGEDFKCELCGRTYKNLSTLLRHIIQHDTPYRCSWCDYTAFYFTHIMEHIATHNSSMELLQRSCNVTSAVGSPPTIEIDTIEGVKIKKLDVIEIASDEEDTSGKDGPPAAIHEEPAMSGQEGSLADLGIVVELTDGKPEEVAQEASGLVLGPVVTAVTSAQPLHTHTGMREANTGVPGALPTVVSGGPALATVSDAGQLSASVVGATYSTTPISELAPRQPSSATEPAAAKEPTSGATDTTPVSVALVTSVAIVPTMDTAVLSANNVIEKQTNQGVARQFVEVSTNVGETNIVEGNVILATDVMTLGSVATNEKSSVQMPPETNSMMTVNECMSADQDSSAQIKVTRGANPNPAPIKDSNPPPEKDQAMIVLSDEEDSQGNDTAPAFTQIKSRRDSAKKIRTTACHNYHCEICVKTFIAKKHFVGHMAYHSKGRHSIKCRVLTQYFNVKNEVDFVPSNVAITLNGALPTFFIKDKVIESDIVEKEMIVCDDDEAIERTHGNHNSSGNMIGDGSEAGHLQGTTESHADMLDLNDTYDMPVDAYQPHMGCVPLDAMSGPDLMVPMSPEAAYNCRSVEDIERDNSISDVMQQSSQILYGENLVPESVSENPIASDSNMNFNTSVAASEATSISDCVIIENESRPGRRSGNKRTSQTQMCSIHNAAIKREKKEGKTQKLQIRPQNTKSRKGPVIANCKNAKATDTVKKVVQAATTEVQAIKKEMAEMEKHLGSRLFICDRYYCNICEKAFMKKKDFVKHMASHCNGISIKCHILSRFFNIKEKVDSTPHGVAITLTFAAPNYYVCHNWHSKSTSIVSDSDDDEPVKARQSKIKRTKRNESSTSHECCKESTFNETPSMVNIASDSVCVDITASDNESAVNTSSDNLCVESSVEYAELTVVPPTSVICDLSPAISSCQTLGSDYAIGDHMTARMHTAVEGGTQSAVASAHDPVAMDSSVECSMAPATPTKSLYSQALSDQLSLVDESQIGATRVSVVIVPSNEMMTVAQRLVEEQTDIDKVGETSFESSFSEETGNVVCKDTVEPTGTVGEMPFNAAPTVITGSSDSDPVSQPCGDNNDAICLDSSIETVDSDSPNGGNDSRVAPSSSTVVMQGSHEKAQQGLPESRAATAGHQQPEPRATTAGHQQPEPRAATAGHQQPEPRAATAGHQQPEPRAATAGHQQPEPRAATEGHQQPEPRAATAGHQQPEPRAATEGHQQPEPRAATEGHRQSAELNGEVSHASQDRGRPASVDPQQENVLSHTSAAPSSDDGATMCPMQEQQMEDTSSAATVDLHTAVQSPAGECTQLVDQGTQGTNDQPAAAPHADLEEDNTENLLRIEDVRSISSADQDNEQALTLCDIPAGEVESANYNPTLPPTLSAEGCVVSSSTAAMEGDITEDQEDFLPDIPVVPDMSQSDPIGETLQDLVDIGEIQEPLPSPSRHDTSDDIVKTLV